MKPDICGRCDAPLTEENWQPTFRKRRYLVCKPCELARQREYRLLHPEKRWKYSKERLYGVSYEQYLQMLQTQNGACAICISPDPGRAEKYFHIDHCHTTGKVRGLLCHSCNVGLGHFKDSQDLLTKAKAYLS